MILLRGVATDHQQADRARCVAVLALASVVRHAVVDDRDAASGADPMALSQILVVVADRHDCRGHAHGLALIEDVEQAGLVRHSVRKRPAVNRRERRNAAHPRRDPAQQSRLGGMQRDQVRLQLPQCRA